MLSPHAWPVKTPHACTCASTCMTYMPPLAPFLLYVQKAHHTLYTHLHATCMTTSPPICTKAHLHENACPCPLPAPLWTWKPWQIIKTEACEGRVRAKARPSGNKLCPAPYLRIFWLPSSHLTTSLDPLLTSTLSPMVTQPSYSPHVSSSMATLPIPMAIPSRFDANGTPKQRKGNEGSSWPLKGPRKHEEKQEGAPSEALSKHTPETANQSFVHPAPFLVAQPHFWSPKMQLCSPVVSLRFVS